MSERETEREEARWLAADLRAWRASVERSIEIAQETIRATREAVAIGERVPGGAQPCGRLLLSSPCLVAASATASGIG